MSNKQKQQVQPAVQPVVANTVGTAVAAKAPECHNGNVLVFSYELHGVKVEFYGGGTLRGSMHTPDMVLIALQGTDYGDVAPVSFKGLSMPSLDKYRNVRIVTIAIPDGSAPGLPLVFWQDLLAELNKLGTGEPERKLKVLVRCAGGHGRTGVVLCALAVAANVCPGQDPIAWVRARYCKKAVESDAQFDYIEWLSGVPSKEDVKPPFPAAAWETWGTGEGMVAKPTQGSLVGMETVGKVTTITTSPAYTQPTNSKYSEALEEELVRARWVDDDALWLYVCSDGSSFKSPEEPTVFGEPLGDGKYGDQYVDVIEYLGDAIILQLQSGEKVRLTVQISADGELELVEDQVEFDVKEQ
jgi:hypothetical protein